MFLESPVFPGCPKFGYATSPLFANDIGRTAGGQEFRNINWEQELRTVMVTVGPGPGGEEEIADVWNFHKAVKGTGHTFRVQDYADYKSTHIMDADATPTALDQPMVLISGNTYQLVKRYTAGALSTDKDIYKLYGTVLISSNGVTLTSGADYTLSLTTGQVTFNSPPTNPMWGGHYHIMCRFADELTLEILQPRIKAISFKLEEVRYESA